MVVLKAVTVIAAALLTAATINRLMGQLTAAKVKAHTRPAAQGRSPVRLRQDPRTGIYYPEN